MHTRPEHAEQLEELQRVCFPTLADEERFKARALPQARRAVSRRPVRRARRRSGRRRDLDASGCSSTSTTSTTRSPTSSRAAGSPRTSPTATGSTAPTSACTPTTAAAGIARGAVRRAAGSGLAPRSQGPGHRRDAARLRRGQGHGCRPRTTTRSVVAGRHQGPDAVDAARRRLRAAGAARELPERSGLGQLQRAARARRRQGRAGRVAETGDGATCDCTRRSPARGPGDARARAPAALPAGLGRATDVVVERARRLAASSTSTATR